MFTETVPYRHLNKKNCIFIDETVQKISTSNIRAENKSTPDTRTENKSTSNTREETKNTSNNTYDEKNVD